MHDVDTRPETLREAADSAPPTPATNHRFRPSPTLRPCAVMLQSAQADPVRQRRNGRPQGEAVFCGSSSQKAQRMTTTSGDVRGAFRGGETEASQAREDVAIDCVSDDLKAFQATSGSTEDSPSVFGVETALWTTAAKWWDKWHDGVVEGAERFMAEWHRQEESKRRARHTKEVARGTRDRRGAGRTDNDSSSTAMEESKVEMANRVARFQVD